MNMNTNSRARQFTAIEYYLSFWGYSEWETTQHKLPDLLLELGVSSMAEEVNRLKHSNSHC